MSKPTNQLLPKSRQTCERRILRYVSDSNATEGGLPFTHDAHHRRKETSRPSATLSQGNVCFMLRATVVVAHPDDETLWCGGLILQRPDWDWFVLTLCRGEDPDRAPRFRHVLQYLGAAGVMADLDDGPAQDPLDQALIQRTILDRLLGRSHDLVLTHGPLGEYTRHRRHEECSAAMVQLWRDGLIKTKEMKLFAYEDQDGSTMPRARADADETESLRPDTLAGKHHIMTHLYGFAEESWEVQATPQIEAFYRGTTPSKLPSSFQAVAALGAER